MRSWMILICLTAFSAYPATRNVTYLQEPSLYKINTGLGMQLLSGTSVLVQVQLGKRLWAHTPLYVGPEASLALFNVGSLTSFFGSVWYEFRLQQSSNLGLALGGLVGVASPSRLEVLRSSSLAVLGDIVVFQDLDDLASIRGQIRPGVVGSRFSMMMSLNASFRFK